VNVSTSSSSPASSAPITNSGRTGFEGNEDDDELFLGHGDPIAFGLKIKSTEAAKKLNAKLKADPDFRRRFVSIENN
jgi:hypothetical protein